jgi:hypothetical protein
MFKMKRLRLAVLFIFLCSVISVNLNSAEMKINLVNRGKNISDIDYSLYGVFKGIGTNKFSYKITNPAGLAAVVGEGVYPNTEAVRNPKYMELVRNKIITQGDLWSHVNTDNPEADFFAWAVTKTVNDPRDDKGIIQFFTAEALKSAGEYMQALKAYYAIILCFPNNACWSADGSFVWYVGTAAMDRINVILREHPELGLSLRGAFIDIKNSDDTDLENDVVTVNPGKFIRTQSASVAQTASNLKIVSTLGTGKVKLVQYNNGQWQMLVDNKPYFVKGITYAPTKVGLYANVPGRETLWMRTDDNKNGKCDSAYDSWVDKNKNNKQDADEPSVGDFKLLKDMGVNTIRMYHSLSKTSYRPEEFNKTVLRDLYKTYGIRVIMGDFLGAYGIGSGAAITDYRDPKQKQQMKKIVHDMVMDQKDEPYILMWILGNENDMSLTNEGVNVTNTNAYKYPVEYASFVNEVAEMIHSLDPNHPVAVGNFSLKFLQQYYDYTPEIDVYGINSYSGRDGFGSLWQTINKQLDVPVLITEYGCDAFNEAKKEEDQDAQSDYHKGNWSDIVYNSFGNPGVGNSIGGVIFEWLDEWWKSSTDSASDHDTMPQSALPFPDGWAHEEWFGVAGQGDGEHSPFLRDLRKVYFMYKNLWAKN